MASDKQKQRETSAEIPPGTCVDGAIGFLVKSYPGTCFISMFPLEFPVIQYSHGIFSWAPHAVKMLEDQNRVRVLVIRKSLKLRPDIVYQFKCFFAEVIE